MEIKTGKEIVNWTRTKSLSDLSISPYDKKWVAVDDILSYLEDNKIPNTRGLSIHGKGFREGANTVINVLALHLKEDK